MHASCELWSDGPCSTRGGGWGRRSRSLPRVCFFRPSCLTRVRVPYSHDYTPRTLTVPPGPSEIAPGTAFPPSPHRALVTGRNGREIRKDRPCGSGLVGLGMAQAATEYYLWIIGTVNEFPGRFFFFGRLYHDVSARVHITTTTRMQISALRRKQAIASTLHHVQIRGGWSITGHCKTSLP